MKFTYKKDLKELEKLASDLESFAAKHDIPQDTLFSINLCLDEVLTNIISYGLKEVKPENSIIEFSITEHNGIVTIRCTDNGVKFNPLLNETQDLTTSIEDRKIGGLGIHFLEQYMDIVEYEHKEPLNILTLTIKALTQ